MFDREREEPTEAKETPEADAASGAGTGAGPESGAATLTGRNTAEWRREVPGPVILKVDQETAGPVAVTGWDKSEVHAVAVKLGPGGRRGEALRDEEVTFSVDGDVVELRALRPDRWFSWALDEERIALTVSVPRRSEVEVDAGSGRVETRETLGPVSVDAGSGSVSVLRAAGKVGVDVGSGTVSVKEVQGDVTIDVGSGAVSVERVAGNVDIDGSSGSVEVKDVEGDLHLDTGSGSARLARIQGNVSADTGSGSVRLAAIRGERLSLDTGSGSIDAEFDVLPGGRYQFDSGSGRVTLYVPGSASFRLSADTGSGPIDCSLPGLTAKGVRGSFAGVVGDGAATIEVDTSSGPLTIRQRAAEGDAWSPGAATGASARGSDMVASVSSLREDNRRAVLKMVEEGKLTAEQGQALLRELGERE